MSIKLFRSVIRWFHIFTGLFVGAYFYSPTLSGVSWSLPLIQYVLLPLLVFSGLTMWNQARVMRWLGR